MISGFYMALVLNGKYGKGAYSLFITNRLLRLFPIYWVLVVLTLAASIGTYALLGQPLKLEAYQQAGHLSLGAWALVVVANLFILGQDLLMFLGLDSKGGLQFTNNFLQSKPPLYTFLFVHQAWSLAIEIMFYLVAPFLVRRRPSVLLVLCAASLLVRWGLYQQGLFHDPWSYRFFPSELVFFLVGALAYRAYVVLQVKRLPLPLLYVAFVLIVAYTVFYQFVPGGDLVRQVGYYVCFALTLPLVFALTKKSQWMNKVGELSYPVYVSHLLMLILLPAVLLRAHLPASLLPYALVISSVVFSMVLVRYVAEPVERLRQRRVAAAKPHSSQPVPVATNA